MAPILKDITKSESSQKKREKIVLHYFIFGFNVGMDFIANGSHSRHPLLTQDLKVPLLEYMDLWMNSSVKCKSLKY